MAKLICKECNKEIKYPDKVCSNCGIKLPKITRCKKCNEDYFKALKKCSNCGYKPKNIILFIIPGVVLFIALILCVVFLVVPNISKIYIGLKFWR